MRSEATSTTDTRTGRPVWPRTLLASIAATTVLLGAQACGREAATGRATPRGGTLVISAFADADLLLPPLTSTGQGLQIVDAVFDRLADRDSTIGPGATYVPMLASSWRWAADSLSLAFAIEPRARWHDGQPVTARDVAFTFHAYVDSAVGSSSAILLANIDSVQAVGDQTAVVWFKRRSPDQFADAVTHMRILPQHLLSSVPPGEWRTSPFARHPVGSGRFRFARWDAGERITIVADSTNYRGRPNLDRIIWSIAPDPSAALLRLFSGDADFIESVRPDAASEFATHPDVKLVRFPSLVYGFVVFNLRGSVDHARPHPVFGDAALRRALSMAVDRATIVRSVFDTLARVSIGPVTRAQLGADTVLAGIPYDTARAARVLDSLGWRVPTPTGIRRKDGRALRFAMLVPSSSAQRMRIAVLLQQMFRSVGVQMDVQSLEFNAFNAALADGSFDAAVAAWSADPELAGIRSLWGTAAGREHGGDNYGSYTSSRFDALIDSAAAETRSAEARRLYRSAYETILADAPAIWLYEPWNLVGMRRRVQPAGLRADGWWAQLGDWVVSPEPAKPTRDTAPETPE